MTWIPDPDSQGYALMNGVYRICKVKVQGKWHCELWILNELGPDEFLMRGTVQEAMDAFDALIERRGPCHSKEFITS